MDYKERCNKEKKRYHDKNMARDLALAMLGGCDKTWYLAYIKDADEENNT